MPSPSLLLCVLLLSSLATASPPPLQDTSAGTNESAEAPISSEDTLRTLLDSRADREARLAEVHATLSDVRDPEQRAALNSTARDLTAEISALTRKFSSIASGVDVGDVEDAGDETFELETEIKSLLEPLITALKSATEGPRQIEELRTQVALYEERLLIADRAITGLQARLDAGPPPELEGDLQASLATWTDNREQFGNARQVATFELQNRLEARKSLVESAGGLVNTFFRSKGFNLLVALGAFVVVFVLLRLVHRRFVEPLRVKRGSFYARLTNVLFSIFVFLAALTAAVVALFSVSDWVLLVVVLIFLVGIGWASVNMLPQFFEQIRLLLDLGSVRENERLIFNDLPWVVESLKLYTTLRNPALTGGLLRVPLRDLMDLHSRPMGKGETWFPTEEGNWVILDDGVRGRVRQQTPDMVHLDLPGGGEKTYSTQTFLGTNPRNLSRGYRAKIVFGVDYDHQQECTEEIPRLMKEHIERDLADLLDADQIHKVTVELREAGASSLDYEVQADIDGSADDRYDDVKRRLSRILVDACNEHGWVIPFSQLTIHRAEG